MFTSCISPQAKNVYKKLAKQGYGKLADVRDIACMKIDAIASRGTKRDFVDLYYLLSRYSFEELLMFFGKKYENVNYNTLHIMKSMAYFADAEDETMPKQTKPTPWKNIKKAITAHLQSYQRL